MKKSLYNFLLISICCSSCSLSKMTQLASDTNLNITPNPLEVHGTNISLTASAVIPPKVLPHGKLLDINFFYSWLDSEEKIGEIEFNSTDFPNSPTLTSRKSVELSFPYKKEYDQGTLSIQMVLKDPKTRRSVSTSKQNVASGLITTSMIYKLINPSSSSDIEGLSALKEADYSQAKKILKNTKNQSGLFCLGLSELLLGEYSNSIETLNRIVIGYENAGLVFYVQAIASARLNEAEMLKEFLSKAIEISPKLAIKASSDLEFARFGDVIEQFSR
jgi:tetratricopeptide (TPR) repeat protein